MHIIYRILILYIICHIIALQYYEYIIYRTQYIHTKNKYTCGLLGYSIMYYPISIDINGY